jgi:penicillin-binding protein 2
MVPSMFHRRLLLLALGAIAAVAVLGTQLLRLTLVLGSDYRVQAEKILKQRSLIPTARGRILDRRLRVLAVDEPSYDLAVHWTLITGTWVDDSARRQAFEENRHEWSELSPAERMRLAEVCREPFEAQVQKLWDTVCAIGGVSRSELIRELAEIKAQVMSTSSAVWARRLQQRSEELNEDLTLADVAAPLREHDSFHTVLRDLSEPVRLQIAQAIAATQDQKHSIWKQVDLIDSRARRYPHETLTVELDRSGLPGPLKDPSPVQVTVGGVGYHLVGTLRPVYREDYERRPFFRDGAPDMGGYRPGDLVGNFGIEKAQEANLRGRMGQETRDRETNQVTRIEPTPGRDVVLSLDVLLQARIQALMGRDPRLGLMMRQPWHAKDPYGPMGEPLNGAAVVLDIETGQVLAAVTVPGISFAQLREDPDSVMDDQANTPYVNRAMAAQYQPGSTIKPLILTAAMTDGKVGHDETIECTGYLTPPGNPMLYRCWIYKTWQTTHGPLAGAEALRRSCNIYFFTLGRRLGSQRLAIWFDRFGLGRPSGCGLAELSEDATGVIPDLARADDPNARGFGRDEAILMGIGQGPIAWTPMQAANAYAAIARGGVMLKPTLLLSDEVGRSPVDLKLKSVAVNDALQGLYEGVNDEHGGTSHHISALDKEKIFNLPGVKVYGKSGTADPGKKIDGKSIGDHAWFVGLVRREGSKRPNFVVAVVVEYAGSGGAVSGPIANQILYALRAEGYL